MKKLIAFLLIAASVITLHSLSAFAADSLPVEHFTITSGIDVEKPCEITFDSSRLITGTAPKDTAVTISVYDITDPDYKKLDGSFTITVGSAGIFSQNVELKEGRNYIVIAAVNGERRSEVSAVVSRKSYQIKSVLSQYIALPGQNK